MTLNAKIGVFTDFFRDMRLRKSLSFTRRRHRRQRHTRLRPMCIMVLMGWVQVICNFRNYNYWTGNAIGFHASRELCSNFLFNILPEFAQTFVLSVNKFLNAQCKIWCRLLSMPLKTTDCTSVSDAIFCPPSIFLHQAFTVHFVEQLLPYSDASYDWIWFVCCLSWKDFIVNVALFNVYKWRHSDVIVIKLTTATQN